MKSARLCHVQFFSCLAQVILCAVVAAGCSLPVLPAGFLDQQADISLSYGELLNNPIAVEGRIIILGGEVLSIEGAEGGMMLEMLELPLGESRAPVMDHAQSRGRFLLLVADGWDKDRVSLGSRLTIIGTVKGTVPQTVHEEQGAYPLLAAERIALWPSWPSPSVFGPLGTNCGPFRGFWPFGGSDPFTGRIYPTC